MNPRVPLIIIGLLFLTLEINALTTYGVCTTTACQQTASRINQYINYSVDPCENFYQFACGTFLKNAHDKPELQFETQLKKRYQHELSELCKEDVKEDDHKVVKVAKNLYNACLNESQIEKDALKTLKKVFEQIGGWPVLEGSKWNEQNFDWINATIKLRELGYHYAGFVNIHKMYDEEKHRQTVMLSFGDYMPEEFEYMIEIVMKFEPESREDVAKELKGADELSKEIKKIWALNGFSHEILTIGKLQEKAPTVNWLEYINYIVGPVVKFTKADRVVLMHYVQSLAELIPRTSKRDVANLMMWQVMKSVIPYLTAGRNKYQSRIEFCVNMLGEKFIPNPMEVIYSRKYLPVEKKNKIQEMAMSMKTIAIEVIDNAEWLTEEAKTRLLKNFRSLKFETGLPGYLTDDKIFDYADADLVDDATGTFFDLLARAQRNLKACEYRLIKKTDDDILAYHYRLANVKGYRHSDNLIYIPAYMTRDMVYDENIPEYMNYGIMGTMLATYASDILCVSCLSKHPEKVKERVNKVYECVAQTWGGCDVPSWDRNKVLATYFGEQVASKAYQKFVVVNGVEQKLVSVSYTPNQLFWISTAFSQCRLIDPTDPWYQMGIFTDIDETSAQEVNNPVSWNNKFLKDFECAPTSKMHISNNCKAF